MAVVKGAIGMSALPEDKSIQHEGYLRLITIHSKNKYGYHTRWMSDFELFLESMLNERFLEESRLAGPTATPKEVDALFRKHGMQEVGPQIDVASLKRPAAE